MYIKLTTQIIGSFPAITIAKAAALAGCPNASTINCAIRDEQLDFGYAFDELIKPPPLKKRPDEGTDKFGQKLVVQNEKWAQFIYERSTKK